MVFKFYSYVSIRLSGALCRDVQFKPSHKEAKVSIRLSGALCRDEAKTENIVFYTRVSIRLSGALCRDQLAASVWPSCPGFYPPERCPLSRHSGTDFVCSVWGVSIRLSGALCRDKSTQTLRKG